MAIWNVDSLIGHLQLALAPALVGAFLALSNRGSASLISTSPPLAASEPRPLLQKILDICELPHKAVATNPLLASSTRRRGDANARMDNRRRGRAIGLIWSVAAMSNLVPVVDDSVSARDIAAR